MEGQAGQLLHSRSSLGPALSGLAARAADAASFRRRRHPFGAAAPAAGIGRANAGQAALTSPLPFCLSLEAFCLLRHFVIPQRSGGILFVSFLLFRSG
jgi:hypothetical protein